jgi:hypothetical protein
MIQNIESREFDNEELFVLHGKISQLHVARSSVNLLAEIEGALAKQSIAVGVAAALSGMHGVLANSLALSLYDGEDTFNFAGIVDGKVAFGSFSRADKIKDGDLVQIVVSKRGDAFYVHSLLRVRDDLLMLPPMVFAGDRAFFRGCMKFAWRFCIFTWISFIFLLYLIAEDGFLHSNGIGGLGLLLFFIPLLLWFPFEYRTYRSMRYYGLYASAIFKTYDFPRPDDLDVRSGMAHYPDDSYGYGGINCKIALESHKKKYGIKVCGI